MALSTSLALKFPRDVSPFCAVREYIPEAFQELFSLFEPGEASFLIPEDEETARNVLENAPKYFKVDGPFGVIQMVWPENLDIPAADQSQPPIVPIELSQATEMMGLIHIAFPGFFRIATNRMGPYYGIRAEDTGDLVAMVGERMNVNDFHELSGLCTHPEYRGKGYAQHLMYHLMRLHKSKGHRTYLHTSPNGHAAKLYERMGYVLLGEFSMYSLTRSI